MMAWRPFLGRYKKPKALGQPLIYVSRWIDWRKHYKHVKTLQALLELGDKGEVR